MVTTLVISEAHERLSGNTGNDRKCISFSNLMNQIPKKNLELLGLVEEPVRDFLKMYDSEDTTAESIVNDHNANVGYRKNSNVRLAEAVKPGAKMTMLEELYENGVRRFGNYFVGDMANVMHGALYIHKLAKFDKPYCIGASAMDILLDGRPYADVRGYPPKHFTAFMGQVTEYIMNLSGEFGGAVAISDLVVCMAWFIHKEGIPMKSKDHRMINVRQQFQSMVHILHNKYRADGDCPFTNISINSPLVIEDMFNGYQFPDGVKVRDLLPTIMEIQRTIAEFMYEGDPDRGGIQYRWPIVTCNFKPADIGTEWWTYIVALNHKGCFNICHAEMFSSCCRLLSDYKIAMKFKSYSNGGGGIKVGSHAVVALNLPMAAKTTVRNFYPKPGQGDLSADNWSNVPSARAMFPSFLDMVDGLIHGAVCILAVHKLDMLRKRMAKGYNIFFSEFEDASGYKTGIGPWLHLNMLFSTIGIHGVPDALRILGLDEMSEEGVRAAELLLARVMERADYYSKKFGENGLNCFFNIEQVPAESASSTMASFSGDKIYSNQFVPLDRKCSIWDRANVEGRLVSMLSGGAMTFLSLNTMMTEEQSIKFHHRIMEVSGGKLNQHCINYGWTVCHEKHDKKAVVGRYPRCPTCKSSNIHHEERVVGYMVPDNLVNDPRQVEMQSRYRD